MYARCPEKGSKQGRLQYGVVKITSKKLPALQPLTKDHINSTEQDLWNNIL